MKVFQHERQLRTAGGLTVTDITDETAEWEVIAPPYSTAGGRVVHARVQKINEPASWEIRSWDALKRINVR